MLGTLLPLVILGVSVVVVDYIAKKQYETYVVQYIFFTRYPIIFGLILVFLPVVGPIFAPAMLRNVFVVDMIGAGLVGFTASFYCWAVVYTWKLTYLSIPLRCKLPFREADDWETEAKKIAERLHGRDYEIIDSATASLSLLLALPLLVTVIYFAPLYRLFTAAGFIAGMFVAMLVRNQSSAWIRNAVKKGTVEKAWDDTFTESTEIGASFLGRLRDFFKELKDDFKRAPAMGVVHARAGNFFAVSLVIVVGILLLYLPTFTFNSQLPAIVILLCILLLLTWMFGRLSYRLDKYRIPIALAFVAFFFIEFLIPNDHVYRSERWNGATELTSTEAIGSRVDKITKDDPDAPVVIVSASGGGIRAALWTGVVLEGLTQVEANTPELKDRIVLMSSVSGGSVGSMYYYAKEYLGNLAADSASTAGGTTSLAPVVWGFAYPEALRLVLGSWMNPVNHIDRGWAQEVAWGQQISGDPMISSLSQAVKTGDSPLHIYNSCLLETGQRYLISPAKADLPRFVNEKQEGTRQTLPRALDSRQLDLDMRLVTAARLSATFPYATPQARSEYVSDDDEFQFTDQQKYRVADGGYYENSGLLTSIELFDRYLEDQPMNSGPKRVAFIEIRADPGDFGTWKSPNKGGLKTELVGPMTTAVNVVFGAQAARNRQELRWMGQLWQKRNGVEVQHFVFYLSHGPLSWHLSEIEKMQIRDHLQPMEQLQDRSADIKTKIAKGKALSTAEREWVSRQEARKYNLNEAERLREFLTRKEE